MKARYSFIRMFFALAVVLCLTSFAQDWQRYSVQEAQQTQRFNAALASDNELKAAYQRYQDACQKYDKLLASNQEYSALSNQLAEAKAALKRLRDADVGGNEVSLQNNYIETLERKLKEHVQNSEELQEVQAEQAEARQALRTLLDKHEIGLFEFRPTLRELFGDDTFDDDATDVSEEYQLAGENPFKDAFADLSQALCYTEFNRAARNDVSAALARDYPDASPETINKCMVFFFEPLDIVVPETPIPDEVQEEIFDEYYRLLCWSMKLPPKDETALQAHRRACNNFLQRLPRGSLLRFINAIQWHGAEHPEAWMDDFVQWLVDTPKQAPLLKYLSDSLNYSHGRDGENIGDQVQMKMLSERLAPYEDKLADKWMLHVARSITAWGRAWKSRGGGYADSVSKQGWQGWEEAVPVAIKEAREAVKLHPDWPAGYLGILYDFECSHLKEFLQLLRYRPDYTRAYNDVVWSLLPRWGGSHAQIVALARACMETRRYDTPLPSLGFSLLGTVAWDTASWSHWNHVYQLPWLEPLAMELFDHRIAQSTYLQRDFRLDKALFLIAIRRYDDALKIYNAVQAEYGDKPVEFPSWTGRSIGNWYPKVPAWEDAKTHMFLLTGKYAGELHDIESLADKDSKAAANLLTDFLKAHPELEAREKVYLIELRARWRMPDRACNNYARSRGWGIAFNGAMKSGRIDVVRELLEAGFDYKKYESYPGHMAIYLVEQGSYPEMLDLLKQQGDTLEQPHGDPKFQGDRPIHMAAMCSNIPMVKHLLELGVSPDARNDYNHAALHFCAQHGSAEGIRVLLAAGANPDVQDIDGDTPLMFIPQVQAPPECLRLLANASKNINLGNRGTMTALHYAAQDGNSAEYIKILLEAGADPQARTAGGMTAYDFAKGRQRRDMLELLPPPDPNGGTVYNFDGTSEKWDPTARTAQSHSTGGTDDWGTVFTEFLAMPEVYLPVAVLLVGAIAFFVFKRKR